MGRLSRHENKEFARKVTLYLVLLAVIFYFIFFYGIKFLLNFSVFIAHLGSNTKQIASPPKDDFVGTLSIDSIPVATNSSRIIVAGSMINYDSVAFYVNGQQVKEKEHLSSDSFQEEINDLKKGVNEVFVRVKTRDGKHEKKSEIYTVTYIADKPKLELKEPQDHSKTNKNEVNVSGSTDKEIFIKINELPVVVDAAGNFQTSVKLKDGDNQIIVTAQDVAGNVETKTLTVTYQKDD